VGNFVEALAAARVAVHQALLAVNRTPGSPEELIYRTDKHDDTDDLRSSAHSMKSSNGTNNDIEKGSVGDENKTRAILPRFEIDSLSNAGLRPDIQGAIEFHDVHFAYPTRPDDPVLDGLSLKIEPGCTVALVGPSGTSR